MGCRGDCAIATDGLTPNAYACTAHLRAECRFNRNAQFELGELLHSVKLHSSARARQRMPCACVLLRRTLDAQQWLCVCHENRAERDCMRIAVSPLPGLVKDRWD